MSEYPVEFDYWKKKQRGKNIKVTLGKKVKS